MDIVAHGLWAGAAVVALAPQGRPAPRLLAATVALAVLLVQRLDERLHGAIVSEFRKRISGHVRLSAKQKVAIRKARLKSHSAKAVMRRLKSVRLRKKLGL